MKTELEALYEGLCQKQPELFEPEELHEKLERLSPAVTLEGFPALLELCEDWQKNAFAVGFMAAVGLLIK